VASKKTKKAKRHGGAAPRMPALLARGLDESARCIDEGDLEEAREILDELDARYPNHQAVLRLQAELAAETRDDVLLLHATERLHRLDPDDQMALALLATACVANRYPIRALRYCHELIERWPDMPEISTIREMLEPLEAGVPAALAQAGLEGDEGLEIVGLLEDARKLAAEGEFAQARRVTERLLERRPDFVPGLTMLGETLFGLGRADEAIAATRRALAVKPDHIPALADLVDYSLLRGDLETAEQTARELARLAPERVDHWFRQLSSLSLLGDDQGVLETFKRVDRVGALNDPLVGPVALHLAAVATMRLGDQEGARALWRQAIERAPGGHALAEQNLADLELPVGEWHAPWSFGLERWLTDRLVADISKQIGTRGPRTSSEALRQRARSLVRQHPELVVLFPILADRGDPRGREIAVLLGLAAGTPELLERFRPYVLGQRGPDVLRRETALGLAQAGLLPEGRVRMWLQGRWQEVDPLATDFIPPELPAEQPRGWV
jgi:tetratricopeptide (TPR) repeat protein